jgi:hypothetical protein
MPEVAATTDAPDKTHPKPAAEGGHAERVQWQQGMLQSFEKILTQVCSSNEKGHHHHILTVSSKTFSIAFRS